MAVSIQLDKFMDLTDKDTITVGTHDGRMHADDVLSVALIKTHIEPAKKVTVVRSRNPEMLSKCDIIVDVGNGFPELEGKLIFDHHGKTETYPNGIRKCSCAMLLDWMFSNTSKSMTNWYNYLLEEWVYGLSAADCGQNAQSYSVKPNAHNFITLMNPTFVEEENNELQNSMFKKAVEMYSVILDRYYQGYNASRNIISYFENDIVRYQGNGIVVLPTYDYLNRIFEYNKAVPDNKKIIVAVTFSMKYGKYEVNCIPRNCTSELTYITHPQEWRNKRSEELNHLTGQVGMFMCHQNGKMSLHSTYASAFNIATMLYKEFKKAHNF